MSKQQLRPVVDWMALRREGGAWLGAARTWMQENKLNGSDVRWGGEETLRPSVTVREVEELAARVAAAAIQEERRRAAI